MSGNIAMGGYQITGAATVTAGSTTLTNGGIGDTSGSIIQTTTNMALTSAGNLTLNCAAAGSTIINRSSSRTIQIGNGATYDVFIGTGGLVSLGSNTNPNSRRLYVVGDVEATNFRGALVGNASTASTATTAATVTTAAQTSITSLGTLTGLTMGGNIAMGSNNITAAGTVTATTLAGTLSTASQPNVTTLGGVTSIEGQTITGKMQYVASMDQSVAIAATPTFGALTTSLTYPSIDMKATTAGGYPQVRLYANNQTTNAWTLYTSGTSTPTITLESSPGNYVYIGWGGTSWVSSSDSRLKKNIENYSVSALGLINALSLKKFNMTNQSDEEPKRIGLIAQDVLNVIPEIVTSRVDKEGVERYGIAYGDLNVYCVKAIQELSSSLNGALARIAVLEAA